MADTAPAPGWLDRAGRTPTVLLGMALFVTYGYFVAPAAWNENSRFDLTRSMVERGRVDIDPFHGNTGDKSFRDGHYYSDKAPGASFLSIVPYGIYYLYLKGAGQDLPNERVTIGLKSSGAFIPGTNTPRVAVPLEGKRPAGNAGLATVGADSEEKVLVNITFRKALYICNLFTNGLAGAALGMGFFVVLCGLGLPNRQAFVTTLALSLGSLAFPYATMLYGHVLSGAFLFGAFALLFQVRQRGEEPSEERLARAGLLCGAAVVAEFPTAVAAGAIAVYALYITKDRLRLVFFASGALGPAVLLFLYQGAAFGSPLKPGYAMVSGAEFSAGMSQGLMGITYPKLGVLFAILFGRFRGLFYLSPVLALGFVGLVRLLRRRPELRPEMVLSSVIVVWFLLMNSAYYMWSGGAALGPRHVIPMLPFLCLGIPFAFERRWWRVVLVLIAISVFNQCVATAVAPEAPSTGDPLFDHAYFHFFHGRVAVLAGTTNLGILIGLPGPLSLIPLGVVWFLTMRVILPTLRGANDEQAPKALEQAP